jgi:GT2 family glycosyltransferase
VSAAQNGRGSSSTNDEKDPEQTTGRFSRLNAAARSARGTIFCFLSPGVLNASEEWLETLAGHMVQEGVGAVGPMLVFTDGTIRSAGLIMGLAGGVQSAYFRKPSRPRGRALRLDVSQNVSAVPADCLMVRREVFESLDGFDSETYPDVYADVDLCLRLIRAGRRVVWTPWASLTLSEKTHRRDPGELERIKHHWPVFFESDPYYNPNLSLSSVDMSLAFPPRISKIPHTDAVQHTPAT